MSESNWIKIDIPFLCKLTGFSENNLSHVVDEETLAQLIYRHVSPKREKEIFLEVLKTTESKKLRISGLPEDRSIWEKGWGEIADRLKDQNFHPSLLIPQYFAFDHLSVLRLNGNFVEVPNQKCMYLLDQIARAATFNHYLKDFDQITDVGCGTGHSELLLAKLFPESTLTATDWTEASGRTIAKIGEYLNKDIHWSQFNMLEPGRSETLQISSRTALLTVHAMEQIGENFQQFVGYLLRNKPGLVLHLEPIAEFYDEANIFDYLALNYHRRRNYLNGFWPHLKNLELEGKVAILDQRRMLLGNQFHEAYSVIAWRPT